MRLFWTRGCAKDEVELTRWSLGNHITLHLYKHLKCTTTTTSNNNHSCTEAIKKPNNIWHISWKTIFLSWAHSDLYSTQNRGSLFQQVKSTKRSDFNSTWSQRRPPPLPLSTSPISLSRGQLLRKSLSFPPQPMPSPLEMALRIRIESTKLPRICTEWVTSRVLPPRPPSTSHMYLPASWTFAN